MCSSDLEEERRGFISLHLPEMKDLLRVLAVGDIGERGLRALLGVVLLVRCIGGEKCSSREGKDGE